MSTMTCFRKVALVGSTLVGIAAQAQQSYDLRAFTASIDFACCNPDLAATSVVDKFNNGNPLAGSAYTSSAGITGNASYTALNNGFSAGAELPGPDADWYGTNLGVGRLRFSPSDAILTAPNNLDPTGSLANRLTLNSPGNGSLLNRAQSFEVATYWNFTTPDTNTYYGLQLSDNPSLNGTPTTPFNDRIDLRVVRGGNGQPIVSLRRLSFDGTTFSQPEAYTQTVSAALLSGHTLGEIKLIELNLHYNAGIGALPYLLPTYRLSDATGVEIGGGSFAQQLTIFNGEDITRVSAMTNFPLAVPEAATSALMLVGLLALGAARRRR